MSKVPFRPRGGCPPTIRRGSEVTVALGDNFKVWDRDALKAMLIAMPSDGVTSVILDGARLTYLDSADLGLLLSTHKRIGGRASVTMTGLDDDLRLLFTLTKLADVFNVAPVLDADDQPRRPLRLVSEE